MYILTTINLSTVRGDFSKIIINTLHVAAPSSLFSSSRFTKKNNFIHESIVENNIINQKQPPRVQGMCEVFVSDNGQGTPSFMAGMLCEVDSFA
jgi:hypothetical protein